MVTLPDGLPPTHEKPSVEDPVAVVGDELLVGDRGVGLLLLLEDLQHLHQQVGIGEEVAADLGVERLALGSR